MNAFVRKIAPPPDLIDRMKPFRLSPYWICQLTGWSATVVLMGGVPTLYGGFRWSVLARALIGGALGLFLTDQLRRLIRRRGWLHLGPGRLVPRIVASSLAIAVTMVLAVLPFLLVIIPAANRAGPLSAILATHFAIILAWCGLYLGYHYLTGVRAAEAEKWRLEVAVRETELSALRAQLNPHFLFNSLNGLRGLVTEDPARAREVITSLAALLRYTLQVSRDRMTTIERELGVTQRYLDLEALRFEARLRYTLDVEPAALHHPVPPMLLQTLVENAIKHGIAHLPEGGAVHIVIRKRPDDLHIRVTNNGTLDDERTSAGNGIGLENAAERLRLMFGHCVNVDLRALAPGEVTCDVAVPSARNSEPTERAALEQAKNSWREVESADRR